MKAVFIDLEFCMIDDKYKKERKISKFEVIEIGAVKIDENQQITERFDKLVKPQYSVIQPFISEMTHITNEMVADADHFARAMDEFLAWIGEDEVAIYSWSNSDWLQFQKECKLKGYKSKKLESLYDNWLDFQMMFGKMLGIEQAISLSNAVEGVGIGFQGVVHTALADAENTALLYLLTQDEEKFQCQAGSLLELVRPKPALTMSMGSLFTPEMLDKLPSA